MLSVRMGAHNNRTAPTGVAPPAGAWIIHPDKESGVLSTSSHPSGHLTLVTENYASPRTSCQPWCADHEHEMHRCVSNPIIIDGAVCEVWLVQDTDAAEPRIAVDAHTGRPLTMVDAASLIEALTELRAAAMEVRQVIGV